MCGDRASVNLQRTTGCKTSNWESVTLQRSVCKAQSLSANIMKAEILPLQSNKSNQRSEKTIE